MQDDLLLQRPDGPAENPELVLLFHGVGSSPDDLAPLGRLLAQHRPRAWVISVRSPEGSDFGGGWQWFSVQGVTEANRADRVAAAMSGYLQRVARWQAHTGTAPERTTLIGFSQGAIMALESTQATTASIAGRVFAIAGRFAQAPRHAAAGVSVHLMHGDQDRVMPIALAEAAHRALADLGVAVTLDRFAGLGHGIDARVVQTIERRWAAATDLLPP